MEHPLLLVSFLSHEIQDKFTHVINVSVVLLIILALGIYVKKSTREIPSRFQVILEFVVKGLYNMGESVMGEAGKKFMPFIISIGFFIAFSNWLGLIPGFLPPTMNINTTAALAVCVFLFYQFIGFKTHGIGYLKQFMGPILVLAPLMFLIELIGHFARPLSLSMRLFGNINGEEVVIAVLFTMVPFIVPLPMYVLATFTGGLQAFVFMLLSMVYISGALEEAH